MTEFLSFPEVLYMVSLGPAASLAGPVQIAVDAHSFVDVEDFFFSNLLYRSDWEILDIEKTFAYAKMYAGDNGERIDFTIDYDGKRIDTHNIDTLDIAKADDEGVKSIADFDWSEIIASVARRQASKNDYSKKSPIK